MKMRSILILLVLAYTSILPQTYDSGWYLELGGNYPRFVNTSTRPLLLNYGGYLTLKYDINEYVAFRLNAKYAHMQSEYDFNGGIREIQSDVAISAFEFVYTFLPCHNISPFLSVGAAAVGYQVENEISVFEEPAIDLAISLGIGTVIKLSERWRFTSELNFYTLSSGKIDGVAGKNNTSSLLGGGYDSFASFSLGFGYYIGVGEQAVTCIPYEGLKNLSGLKQEVVDYDRIEDIVKRNIPREVIKEVVVEKPVPSQIYDPQTGELITAEELLKRKKTSTDNNWVLVGINFDFNSANLKPESYPVLYHALQVLLQNPNMKVEIIGYTDNIGSTTMNLRLSQERANAVKNYFVKRGVNESRLTAKGMGENNPISDNKTASGRKMNRRIEFRIVN